MKRFESIIMSENEPEIGNTLWLKLEKSSIKDNELLISGLWMFGDNGWQSILDETVLKNNLEELEEDIEALTNQIVTLQNLVIQQGNIIESLSNRVTALENSQT